MSTFIRIIDHQEPNKKCSCGNPVRAGKRTVYTKHKNGDITAYVYSRLECNDCFNAIRKGKHPYYRKNTLIAY